MATYYKGDEIKFAINLEAQGFSMDDDDFEVEVASPRGSVKGYKGVQKQADDPVVIFKETPQGGDGTWFAIVDTTTLAVGDLRVIATAHVIDPNANDGIRRQIAVQPLCLLKTP